MLVAAAMCVLLGCGDDGEDDTSSAASSASASSSSGSGMPAEYVLDFTLSDQGGVLVGGNFNFAFSLSETTPRRYMFVSAGGMQVQPGAILSNDFTRCSDPQLLEANIASLERMARANVDVVSIDLKHAGGAMDPTGGFCYGYRTAGGGWTWELAPTAWTYTSATSTYHVDLMVHQENVDAIKVVSTSGSLPMTKITYTTFEVE
jgi:hypothetical protein